MSMLLTYSGPGDAISAQTAALVRRLRTGEQGRFARIALLFMIGVPLCFAGPLVFTLMLIGTGAGWWRLFGFSSAIGLPLLFLYEEQTRGRTILDLIKELRRGNALALWSDLTWEVEAPRTYVVLEAMAIGPRITVRAVRELFARARLRQVPLVQVAHTLNLLITYEHGTSPAELAARTDDIRGTLDALIYLVFHEWAEMSLDRRRVWVPLYIREALKDLASA